MKRIYLILSLAISPVLVFSQNQRVFNWEGAVFIGVANYSGDINPSDSPRLQDTRIAGGIAGRVPLSAKFGLRSNMIYGKFIGDDLNFPERASRGFRFETTLFELSLLAEFEPFGRDRFYSDARGDLMMDRLLSPYLVTGVGLAFTKLNPDFSRNTSPSLRDKIAADLRESSSRLSPVVPVGVGLKFDISGKYALALEAGLRLTFSDYIDGISQAARPDADDVYLFSGLLFYYRF